MWTWCCVDHLKAKWSIAVISEDLTNDTHSLAHVVEVQYGQQLVGDSSSHLTECDGLGSPGPEDKPKVSRCSDQGSLVRWLGLVHQMSFMLTETSIRTTDINSVISGAATDPHAQFTFTLLLWHDGVTQSQQSEELLHCRILQFNGFNQGAVVKLKPSVTQRIEGKVHAGSFLKNNVIFSVGHRVKHLCLFSLTYFCNFHLLVKFITDITWERKDKKWIKYEI